MNVLTYFVKGSSDNLPQVDFNMIHEFYMNNMDYLFAESRNTKNSRATRSSYGDNAIGYVQLKRESHKCTVKARITPEHREHGKMYAVSVVVDENENKILSNYCEDCAAS
ncbi:unnamed protein product [Phaedon cochleariae]|uniref:Uncharacterized protein n=1 Tax=Phaedon cochleariae TaxID=80249 RepID=A0A9N9X4X9_PHACE|nr:unnamed protein product [Phaedon cochleariae]